MNETCCGDQPGAPRRMRCPISGSVGQPVQWTTMAALVVGEVPPRQQIALCRDSDCDLVYFGDHGLELRSADMRTVPGFKRGSDGLVCYCFLHTRDGIQGEVLETGRRSTFESISRQVKAKNCACEVRNPTGKCCLREIRQISDEAMKEREG